MPTPYYVAGARSLVTTLPGIYCQKVSVWSLPVTSTFMRFGRWEKGKSMVVASLVMEADVWTSGVTPQFIQQILPLVYSLAFRIHTANCPTTILWCPMPAMGILLSFACLICLPSRPTSNLFPFSRSSAALWYEQIFFIHLLGSSALNHAMVCMFNCWMCEVLSTTRL